VRVGGADWPRSWISHRDLLGAGTIDVALTGDPASTNWGRGAANQPPRHGSGESLGARPFVSVPAAGSPALLRRGDSIEVAVGAVNLTGTAKEVAFGIEPPEGIAVTPVSGRITVAPGERASVPVTLTVGADAAMRVHTVGVKMTDAGTGASLGGVSVAVKVASLSYLKPATQKSTAWGGVPSRAVDGVTDGNWGTGSVTHTAEDGSPEPWWQVDLGAAAPITDVAVWNRTDCCSERLTNYYVLVSESPFTSDSLAETLAEPGVTAVHLPGTAGAPTTVPVKATGRYVRIQLATTAPLSLAEVEVLTP